MQVNWNHNEGQCEAMYGGHFITSGQNTLLESLGKTYLFIYFYVGVLSRFS